MLCKGGLNISFQLLQGFATHKLTSSSCFEFLLHSRWRPRGRSPCLNVFSYTYFKTEVLKYVKTVEKTVKENKFFIKNPALLVIKVADLGLGASVWSVYNFQNNFAKADKMRQHTDTDQWDLK